MTPLEKAARAAYFSYGFTSPWESDPASPFTSAQHDTKEKFRSLARAVLMAVREPDLGMRKVCRSSTAEEWPVVIDHILRGGQTQPPNEEERG